MLLPFCQFSESNGYNQAGDILRKVGDANNEDDENAFDQNNLLNISTITIDDNVPTDQTQESLNSNLLTTQLPVEAQHLRLRGLTWNTEGIKSSIHFLSQIIQIHVPDLVFPSELQVFQADIVEQMNYTSEYFYHLNSDDLYDPELPLIKSRAVGGTLVMWKTILDPYVSIHP